MNRLELTKAMAKKADLSVQNADKALIALCEVVKGELKKGGEVSIVGFGKWEVRNRAKRNSYNPHTKKTIVVPAMKVPAFKAGKALKMAVNRQK